jgi:L-alanine-DL-glutamate epimerase-like enolase superfamily enzyme
MKITDIEVFPLSFPHPPGHRWEKGELSAVGWDQVIIRVQTDDGITGIGESYHLKNPHTIQQSLKPILLGEDPFDTEKIWARLFTRTVQLGSAAIAGIAGIDTALWDIKGKALNMPVYKLLGGTEITEIPLYVGGHVLGWRDINELDDLIEEAKSYVEQGFRALKVRGGRGLPDRGDIETVRALREAFGDRIEILIDINSEYGDYCTALRMAHELEEYNIYWLEDPFRFTFSYHGEQIARLSQETNVPISTGGNVFGRFPIKRICELGGVDYVMANVSKAGGITEVRKIITLLETWNIKYSPHCDGGLNMMANLHLFASAPSYITANVYHEWDPIWPTEALMSHPPVVRDGKAILPDRPGLGTDLREGVGDEYPLRSDTWFRYSKLQMA